MILSHTLLVARMAAQGKSIGQVMNALRGRYTQEEVEKFWPNAEEPEAPEAPPLVSDAEAYGLPDPAEPGLSPAEKGQRTKALNKAKAADSASTFE